MKMLRILKHVLFWPALVAGMITIAAIVQYVGRPSEKSGTQPSFAGVEQQKKRLAIFLDGTWNSVDTNTNVWRMRALCSSKSADNQPQVVYYSIGVNGFWGGLFGQGVDENIRLAYEWLIENYTDGDEIFIFGFSRGAYTARSLAGLIAITGILKAGSPIGISDLYDRYKRGDEESIWTLKEREAAGDTKNFTVQEKWLTKYSQPAKIKMVGVWDTVGSVGIKAGDIPGISRSSFDYQQTGLRIHILHSYHALAIDEHRADFEPTLWSFRRPSDLSIPIAAPRQLSDVEQRWFVGAHANVGGGYETDLLAQAPLRWIMSKAEVHGLTFRSGIQLDGDDVTAPITDSYGKFAYGIYSWVSRPLYRTIGRDPEIRSNGTHTNINETIDGTVFSRWRTDSTYRPTNLLEWAKRKKIEPGDLKTSVRADDPRVAVP